MNNKFRAVIIVALLFSISIAKAQLFNPVAYYPFNANAQDESGNGYDGTLIGPTLTTDNNDELNSAYLFDGVDDKIQVGTDLQLIHNTNTMTISAWIYPEEANPFQQYTIVSERTNGNNYQFAIWNQNIYFSFWDGGGAEHSFTGSSIQVDKWSFVAVTYDGANVKLYIDGNLDSVFPSTALIANNNTTLYIGSIWAGTGLFKGKLDEVSLYTTSLSSEQIEDLFCTTYNTISITACASYTSPSGIYTWESSGTYSDTIPNVAGCDSILTIDLTINPLPHNPINIDGLVAYYPFNNNANDESGNGNDGTLMGPTAVSDRDLNPNSAYYFDGSTDYILINDPVPASLQIQDEITLSAWIYATSYPGSSNLGLIVGSQCDGCGHVGASIFLDGRTNPDGITAPPGHIHFNLGNGSTWRYSNSNSQVPLNQWVHIVATRKANEDAKIYYNGVLQPVNGVAWDGTVSYTGAYFAIGREKYISNRHFEGIIDDVHVFNRAIDSTEINSLSQTLIVSADNDIICENTSTNINLINSQDGVSYQLIKDGFDYGSPQLSAGEDLTFNSGNLIVTSQFTIMATDDITGCSSLLDTTLTVTVNFAQTNTVNAAICSGESYTYTDGTEHTGITADESYVSTLAGQAINGCDSIVTENITVLPLAYTTVEIDVCSGGSFTYADGTEHTGITTDESYVSTLAGQAINGCDSIVTENITVLPLAYNTVEIDVCSGGSYTYADGTEHTGITADESYVSTLAGQAINGCDSIVTENITVLPLAYNTVEIDVCSGGSYTYADGTEHTGITADESYVSTLAGQAINGCDSIVTENITVLPLAYTTVEIDVCSGGSYTYADGTEHTGITADESYVSTLAGQAINGCDSIVTENITVLPLAYTTVEIDVCSGGSYKYADGTEHTGITADESYVSTLAGQAINGCDSIVTENITVLTVDVSVTESGISLSANLVGANYQWIDCNDNNNPISGETNNSFTATEDGNYAVIIDDGACVDTSICYTITGVGIKKLNSTSINIYPNPTKGNIIIEGENISSIRITDINGKLIKQLHAIDKQANIDLSEEAKGIYFVNVSTVNEVLIKKIVLK